VADLLDDTSEAGNEKFERFKQCFKVRSSGGGKCCIYCIRVYYVDENGETRVLFYIGFSSNGPLRWEMHQLTAAGLHSHRCLVHKAMAHINTTDIKHDILVEEVTDNEGYAAENLFIKALGTYSRFVNNVAPFDDALNGTSGNKFNGAGVCIEPEMRRMLGAMEEAGIECTYVPTRAYLPAAS
jgi:hypothetical protein